MTHQVDDEFQQPGSQVDCAGQEQGRDEHNDQYLAGLDAAGDNNATDNG
jgi:hypothetical protein